MNEELIELYVEGFKRGYWSPFKTGELDYSSGSPQLDPLWADKVDNIENPIVDRWMIDDTISYSWERRKLPEWKEAQKRWNKLKTSKLWRSLK
jgi:hypothetical protein